MAILTTLASQRYEGRGTGLKGGLKATAFVAEMFEKLGLDPAGEPGSYFQAFPFPTGVKMGADSHARLLLELGGEDLKEISVKLRPDVDYLPLAFGAGEKHRANEDENHNRIVFAGYGIQAKDYDSFAGLDVKDKWIAAFRGVPEKDGKPLQGGGPLIAKAKLAHKLGAAGIIYIKGFNELIPSELVALSTPIGGEKILPALSVSNKLAEMFLTAASTDGNAGLKDLYRKYADRETIAGFETEFGLDAAIDLENTTGHGRNVLARLQVGDEPSEQVVMIGAHADHVGFGNRGGSLAKGLTANRIHPGADDNGSGITGLLEVAQYLTDLHQRGELAAKRDIVFAAWSGEEMGLIGSKFWVAQAQDALGKESAKGLRSQVAAYLNLDMIGRVRENKLKVQGTGSSSVWPGLVVSCSSTTTLELNQEANPNIPTDVASFTAAGIPILAAFSGLHPEYHTPGDTPGKVNYDGLIGAARFMAEVLQKVAAADEAPDFIKYERQRDAPKVIIGFVPQDTGSGIGVAQVNPGSAAEKAGLAVGDILLELNKEPVTDMGSLQKILRKLEAGNSYPLRIRRGEENKSLEVVPAKR